MPTVIDKIYMSPRTKATLFEKQCDWQLGGFFERKFKSISRKDLRDFFYSIKVMR